MIKYIKNKRELNKCLKKGIKIYTKKAYDDTYFLQIDNTINGNYWNRGKIESEYDIVEEVND